MLVSMKRACSRIKNGGKMLKRKRIFKRRFSITFSPKLTEAYKKKISFTSEKVFFNIKDNNFLLFPSNKLPGQ